MLDITYSVFVDCLDRAFAADNSDADIIVDQGVDEGAGGPVHLRAVVDTGNI